MRSKIAATVMSGAILVFWFAGSFAIGQTRGGNAQQPRLGGSGACPATVLAYRWGGTPVSTKSLTFVNITETSFSFTQGGSTTSCVVVTFSAEAKVGGSNDSMMIQPLIDGSNPCLVPQVAFATSGPFSYASHAASFRCHDIAPGRHTVIMQYRSENGGSVSLRSRMVLVHHR